MSEASTDRVDGDDRPAVLVLVSGADDAGRMTMRLGGDVGPWRVTTTALDGDNATAAGVAEWAIQSAGAGVVLFIGAGIAIEREMAGNVVAATRESALHRAAGPRVMPRRIISDVAPPLAIRAGKVAGSLRWQRRIGRPDPDAGLAQVGLAATGSAALEHWTSSPDGYRAQYGDTLVLCPRAWDFTFGYHGAEDLRVMAVYGLCEPEAFEEQADPDVRAAACDRAAAFALELLAGLDPADVRADPFAQAAQDGEEAHLRGDRELLTNENTKGFVQRPFLASPRAASVRREPRESSKARVPPALLNALLESTGSPDPPILSPDLRLGIRLDGSTLRFELNSSNSDVISYHMRDAGSIELSGEFGTTPQEYRARFKRSLRAIAAEPEARDEHELKMLGWQLYDELFPAELKALYAEFRGKVRTLQITSQEPWIPWELVRPYTEDWEDDFLCMEYAMTRWLAGDSPRRRFQIGAMASVEAGAVRDEAPLETAKEECAHLIGLATRHAVQDLSPSCADIAAVRGLLKRNADSINLWHVAAHGKLGTTDPNDAYIVLTDRPWRAGDLRGPDVLGIRTARPLVFFNACLVAEQDFSLTKLGGWPAAWIVDSHCGGFVGPQWSVSSELATVFSRAFYEALLEPQTLGEAALTARKAVREQSRIDPAFLSYAVYGDPNAVIRFGRPAVAEPVPA